VHLIDINNIFSDSSVNFNQYCTQLYDYQYKNNLVYRNWVNLIHPNQDFKKTPQSIPSLPIAFFKEMEVITGKFIPEKIFESSGTTGTLTSRHFVKNVGLYESSFCAAFELFYGDIKDYCVLALLPAYLERENSSLVYMAEKMITESCHNKSGFYLYNFEELNTTLKQLEAQGQKTLLIGVTFALLDFSEMYPQKLKHTTVMETGGMKGRGQELTKKELHSILKNRFGVDKIHAEYGMTELMSQAYSCGDGKYICPPWMKILVRSEDDPLLIASKGTGLLQIIDLANIDSCSFIATDDIGNVYEDGSFEVLGRLDNTDLRGCSLLVV